MLFLDQSSVGVFQLVGLFHLGEVSFTSVALLLMNRSFYILSALKTVSMPIFQPLGLLEKEWSLQPLPAKIKLENGI